MDRDIPKIALVHYSCLQMWVRVPRGDSRSFFPKWLHVIIYNIYVPREQFPKVYKFL